MSVHADVLPESPDRARSIETAVLPVYEVPTTVPPTEEDRSDYAGLRTRHEGAQRRRLTTSWSRTPTLVCRLPNVIVHNSTAREEARRPRTVRGHDRAGARDVARRARANRSRRRDVARQSERRRHLRTATARCGSSACTAGTPAVAAGVGGGGSSGLDVPDDRRWYPFQLAFMLLALESATKPGPSQSFHPVDAIVDLLWYPTGTGGPRPISGSRPTRWRSAARGGGRRPRRWAERRRDHALHAPTAHRPAVPAGSRADLRAGR